MDNIIQILPFLFGVVTAVIGLLVNKFSSSRKLAQEENRRAAQKAVANAQFGLVMDLLADIPEQAKQRYINYLLVSQRSDGSFPEPPIVISPSLNVPEIEKQVEERVLPLKQRLEEIERRFPHESTIEKIASVNEAVLAARLDSLTESLKRIEDKMLTKWDVTVVVLEIIAVLAALTGVVAGIINYFVAKGTP
jgi:hypothetical protein